MAKRFRKQLTVSRYATLFLILLFVTQAALSSESVDFTLPDVDGELHSLSDFRGEWVIVNFWATWCSPCLKEIPEFNEMSHMTEPVPVVVIGIDFEEIETEPLKKFMEALEMNYLVLRVGQSPLIPFEPLKGLPTTFIVSPDGRIVYTKIGQVTKDTLIEQLEIQLEQN